MSGKEDCRIFVGGLARDITDRQLEHAFSGFGKIIESQVMVERDTRRPRGFGFITFSDRRAMDDAIREMHGRELGDRVISVNKAQPKGDDADHGHRGSHPSNGRGSYGAGDKPVAKDECFKCGRFGHWARDCPSAAGARVGSRYDDHRDRFRDRDRYIDERYGDRERFDSRDDKYGPRDRYVADRYAPVGDLLGDRYGGSDSFPQNGYGRDRGYDRDFGPREGSNRYAARGPARDDARGYRNRAAPYDRPPRGGGRPSSFDRY